jgi:DNA-directed RNA polymerase
LDDSLLVRQLELENACLTLGQQRFRERVAEAEAKGEASSVAAYRSLLSHAIDPVQRGLEALIAEAGAKRGVKHIAVKWVSAVGAETAAFITAKVALDCAVAHETLQHASQEISGLILDELRYRRFAAQVPGLFEYTMTKKADTTNYRIRKAAFDQAMRWQAENPREAEQPVDVSDLQLGFRNRVTLGSKLLDVFVHTTGLITVSTSEASRVTKRSRLKSETRLHLADDTGEWVEKRHAIMEMLAPVALPMVVEPLDWKQGVRGGYRFGLRNKYGMIRGQGLSSSNDTNPAQDMPVVYAALNTIQRTAWRINPAVLKLVRDIKASGRGVAGLPSWENEPLPGKPKNFTTNENARRKWKRAASPVHHRNRQSKKTRAGVDRVLRVVDMVLDAPAIYFPHSLDFRGRVYPISNYLNPQGDDLSKGLLMFAEGKPLGDTGIVWLAIHGANCMDTTPQGEKVSKMTLDERVQWVWAHSNAICAVADDPWLNSWWASAEDPLQFYAFCVEWRNAVVERSRTGAWSYVCALPCSMDGSCNGLQHFAAMLRDAVGGRAVNLVPSDRPQDVYQYVCDAVLDALQADTDEPLALLWLQSGLVTRKLTKRPTMTFGYGSKRFGFRQQLIDYLRKHDDVEKIREHFGTVTVEKDGESKEFSAIPGACGYMSGLIWDALSGTTVAAYEGMAWMQKAARKVAALNKPVRWTVPETGLRVSQNYCVMQKDQVRTTIGGQVFKPSVFTTTPQIKEHKQTNAIAPNFVHSLDAACLMLTVNAAVAQGVTSFAMIHDSYGTVPADCETLAQVIRSEFVRFYSENDVVEVLHADLLAQSDNDPEMPAPPAKGSLDLRGVIDSQYFFA